MEVLGSSDEENINIQVEEIAWMQSGPGGLISGFENIIGLNHSCLFLIPNWSKNTSILMEQV